MEHLGRMAVPRNGLEEKAILRVDLKNSGSPIGSWMTNGADMEKIRLGKTGMMATRLGFGGIPIQRLTESEAVKVVQRCLDLGLNYIDTANAYSTSEERIGKAIKGRRRGDVIIATKTFPGTPDLIQKNLELSLKIQEAGQDPAYRHYFPPDGCRQSAGKDG
jgi:hypothetical protein